MPEPETSKPEAGASGVHPHAATLKRLEKSSGSLAAQAIARRVRGPITPSTRPGLQPSLSSAS